VIIIAAVAAYAVGWRAGRRGRPAAPAARPPDSEGTPAIEGAT
jgi:hypothetical protein